MSLTIDGNLEYIIRILHISNTAFYEKYSEMTVEEIIQAEAAQGNQAAIGIANQILNNPSFVINLFDLADNNNKFLILREMNSQQLQEFLPKMEQNDLLQGLYYFSKDKLMKLLEELPSEQLVNVVFQMFSKEKIVEYMPDEQLNKFLTSHEIDKNKILKHMQSIPPEYVAQVLEQITGEAVDDNKMNSIDLSKEFSKLNPLDYQNALQAFQPIQKQQLVLSLGKEHTEWFQLFDAHAYTKIINREKEKPEVVKNMNVVEHENIENMLKELPDDLLSTVITQIDTENFAEILIDKMPEIIARIMIR